MPGFNQPFNLGTDPRGLQRPKGQGIQGPGGFAEHISNLATEIRARKAQNPFKGGPNTPEALAKYMDPAMGMLGSVTNITGKGMPGVFLRGVKTNPQDRKLAANWFDEAFKKHPDSLYLDKLTKLIADHGQKSFITSKGKIAVLEQWIKDGKPGESWKVIEPKMGPVMKWLGY